MPSSKSALPESEKDKKSKRQLRLFLEVNQQALEQLFDTLRARLGAAQKETVERLNVLLGRSVEDPEVREGLSLALRARDLVQSGQQSSGSITEQELRTRGRVQGRPEPARLWPRSEIPAGQSVENLARTSYGPGPGGG